MLEQQACEVLMTDKEGYSGGGVNGTPSVDSMVGQCGKRDGTVLGEICIAVTSLPFCSFLKFYFVI